MLIFRNIKITLACATGMLCLILACDESLPPYRQPENSLAITRILPAQGLVGGGIPILNIYIIGENLYEETFDDTVNVSGEVRIIWKRHPEITATLPMSNAHFVPPTPLHGSRLTLDPDDEFYMQTIWYLGTDDGQYFIDLLDFSANNVLGDYEYARPEDLIIEVDLLIFRQIGMITSEPIEFEFNGYRPVHGGL